MAIQQSASDKVNLHPSGDERYSSIDKTMKQFKFEKDSLLEVLNAAQETFGYLFPDLLIYISTQLGVPMSQVYGVATFYHLFTFEPQGDHNCIICTGTACHVKGADRIMDALSEEFKLEVGETTPDGLFSLNTARCVGSCGLAPVVVFDGVVYGKETSEAVKKRIEETIIRSKEEIAQPMEVK